MYNKNAFIINDLGVRPKRAWRDSKVVYTTTTSPHNFFEIFLQNLSQSMLHVTLHSPKCYI